jgi:hypothetical protein
MGKPATMGIDLLACDVSGQKKVQVKDVPGDSTVGELIEGLRLRMDLPAKDANGQSVVYHARLERQGRHLHASELVGEALVEEDQISLHPNIDAGGE